MLNVVLSLNNSEPSKYAFDWAMHNILRPEQHTVTILTVVEPPIQAGYYYAASAGTDGRAYLPWRRLTLTGSHVQSDLHR